MYNKSSETTQNIACATQQVIKQYKQIELCLIRPKFCRLSYETAVECIKTISLFICNIGLILMFCSIE